MSLENTSRQTAFSSIEWMIAFRYLRSRKSEGGASSIVIIALLGIALGVAAMIVTFAVREGFRVEYVRTILGNQAHATVQTFDNLEVDGQRILGLPNYEVYAQSLGEIEGVNSAVPVVRRQAMISANQVPAFTEVFGVRVEEFEQNDRLVNNMRSFGNIESFQSGQYVIALGEGIARQLGVTIGDKVLLTTASAVETAFGSFPREAAYDVVYIIDSGDQFVDGARVYVPIDMAQSFFNLEGYATQIDLRVEDAEQIGNYRGAVEVRLDGIAFMRDWKQNNFRILEGLKTEDNVVYILTSVLVIVSCFSIAAGLIMLVKNKTSDIAILRTMGFSRGRVMRIFLLAGLTLAVLGNILGVILASMLCYFFDQIFIFVSKLTGGFDAMWAFQVIENLNPVWSWPTVMSTCLLALTISGLISIWPASSAARLDPVEALRHG